MSTPPGDLPDWQAFVAPPVLNASTIDQPASVGIALFSSAQPFRVWGVWIRLAIASSSAFVASTVEGFVKIADGFGNVLLDACAYILQPGQLNHMNNSIAVPGFTPQFGGGSYNITATAAGTAANIFMRWSAGIYYSVP